MLKIADYELKSSGKKIFQIEDFILEKGKSILIIGNNNAGKTLFLRSIHGDYSDFQGELLVQDKNPLFYKKRKNSILIGRENRVLKKESIWKNLMLPLMKVSARQRQKIMEFCSLCGLGEIFHQKVDSLSDSSIKLIEIIRAVIQLPSLILIDDIDIYFDEIYLMKANRILEFALKNGSSVIGTAKHKLENFSLCYRIQNEKMAVL